jgi:hypothetical protein
MADGCVKCLRGEYQQKKKPHFTPITRTTPAEKALPTDAFDQ